MDPAQLDPNGDGGGRVVGSNSRRVDDTRVRPTPSQSRSRVAIPKLRRETVDPHRQRNDTRPEAGAAIGFMMSGGLCSIVQVDSNSK